jgi:hypothetical protein
VNNVYGAFSAVTRVYERTGIQIEIGLALHTGTAGSSGTRSWQLPLPLAAGLEPVPESHDHLEDPSCTTFVDEIVEGVLTPRPGSSGNRRPEASLQGKVTLRHSMLVLEWQCSSVTRQVMIL